MKENKAKPKNVHREREEKNCERVFSTITQSSSYVDVIVSDHCSMISLNRFKKLKLLTIKLKVNLHWMLSKQSPMVLSVIYDDGDDADGAAIDVDGNGEDDNHYGDKDV